MKKKRNRIRKCKKSCTLNDVAYSKNVFHVARHNPHIVATTVLSLLMQGITVARHMHRK